MAVDATSPLPDARRRLSVYRTAQLSDLKREAQEWRGSHGGFVLRRRENGDMAGHLGTFGDICARRAGTFGDMRERICSSTRRGEGEG